MIACKLLQNVSLVKKMKMLVVILSSVVITDIVLIVALWLWLAWAYPDGGATLVRSSPYRVVIRGEPAASGNVYWLGRDRHLLVLTPKSSKYDREFYHISLLKPPKVGTPDYSNIRQIPFFSGALVHRDIFDGAPLSGMLEADWKVNDREVRICIRGPSDAAQKADPGNTSERTARELPLAYQREIVLRQTSLDRFLTKLAEEEKK